MISLTNVSKRYPSGNLALDNVNLEIDKGEFVFIVGSSGAGKSTLMRLLLREEVPTSGRIIVNGKNVGELRRREIPYFRRTLGVVFQDFRLIPTMNVYDNVAFALRATNVSTRDIRQRVPYILNLVGLQGKARSMPEQISGGEQQRVALARALVNNPDIILADEPTATSTRSSPLRLWSCSPRSTRWAPPWSWSPMSTTWWRSSSTGSSASNRAGSSPTQAEQEGAMGGSSLGYLMREGARNIYANKQMSAAAIGVLVACLLLIGASILFSFNANSFVGYVEAQNEVVVFLTDGPRRRGHRRGGAVHPGHRKCGRLPVYLQGGGAGQLGGFDERRHRKQRGAL